MISIQNRDTELSLHLYKVFAKSFKSVSEHTVSSGKIPGFNSTAFAVLELLYLKGQQPIQQIGANLLLQSGNVTYVIDKLESHGLLIRRPCPNDRRVSYADLTEAGRMLMDEAHPPYAQQLTSAFSGLDEQEKLQLITLLKKMGKEAQRLSPATRKS